MGLQQPCWSVFALFQLPKKLHHLWALTPNKWLIGSWFDKGRRASWRLGKWKKSIRLFVSVVITLLVSTGCVSNPQTPCETIYLFNAQNSGTALNLASKRTHS